MSPIICNADTLERTIGILQAAGARKEERVVLWLGYLSEIRAPFHVSEVYEPAQITAVDYFKMPPESLRALAMHLRTARLKILAQVHSHPGEAFHSKADDKWAIVRHVGALSLVVPEFAHETTAVNFLDQAVTYQLSADNKWISAETVELIKIIGDKL